METKVQISVSLRRHADVCILQNLPKIFHTVNLFPYKILKLNEIGIVPTSKVRMVTMLMVGN
jgi:hypothetical protein